MGWLFTQGLTRVGLIRERTQGSECGGRIWKCLAYGLRGNVLWSVWEVTEKESGQQERFIQCDLIGKQRNFGWGYKGMTEDMHPIRYSCPISYLHMAPVKSEAWRKSVRAYHRRMSRRFQYGELIRVGDWKMKVVREKPLIASYGGKLYRVRKSEVTLPAEVSVDANCPGGNIEIKPGDRLTVISYETTGVGITMKGEIEVISYNPADQRLSFYPRIGGHSDPVDRNKEKQDGYDSLQHL